VCAHETRARTTEHAHAHRRAHKRTRTKRAARLRARGLLGEQLVVQLREVVLEVVALVRRVLVELPQPVLGLPRHSCALHAVARRLHAGKG
jgi:hypothetical protein